MGNPNELYDKPSDAFTSAFIGTSNQIPGEIMRDAAPLILLAQTRQADRDKSMAQADAQHREALAAASEQRQALAARHTEELLQLLQQNTQLTEIVKELSQRIETPTLEIHDRMFQDDTKPQ